MGAARRVSPANELLEREQELAELEAAVAAARRGEGRAVAVEARAGIGKSRLLAEAVARASGMRVLRARGAALETDFPFGVALQLLEPPVATATGPEREELFAGAAGLASPLFSGSAEVLAPAPDERLLTLAHGLFWLLANLAHVTPLLVVVDDAHWADRSSLTFLVHLADRLEDLPVCLVAAWRPAEPDAPRELLDALRAVPDARVLRPGRLSRGAVTELVARRRPNPDASFCAVCAEVTGGNPLLVRELVAELERRDIPAAAAEAPRVGELVPDGVASTVDARLGELPPAAEALAKAAAILGEEADATHAATLAGLEATDAADAVDALTGVGLLEGGAPHLRFAHQLVAAAVVGRLPPGEAGLLRRRAARILHEAGAPPARVAAQLDAAPGGGEAWAFEVLTEAARRAMRGGAPSSAARWLRRALTEAADRGARATALGALGRAELALGDRAGGARIAEAVELERHSARRAELLVELARAQAASGDLEAGAESAEGARREPAAREEPLATEVEAAWVTIARHVPRLQASAAERMDELLERPRPSTHGERALLVAAANHAVFAGQPFERVRELAHRGLDDGALLAGETTDGLVTWALGVAALGWADDFAAVQRLSDAALADARARGSLATFVTASHSRSYAAFHGGRVADAVADCRQSVEAAPDPARTLFPFTCVQLAWAELERGELDAAQDALVRSDPENLWASSPAFTLVLQARGCLALARGRPDEALSLLLESGELAAAAQIPNPSVVPWRAPAVAAALALGQRDQARRLAAEDLELARRFGAPRALAVALRAAGLAARDERGLRLLREAVATLEHSGAVLELARTLVELGAAERRAGSRAVARESLRRGLDLARRSGALALALRAEQELEATGARRGTAALSGPASLTPGELRVARMAADGMTNREIAQSLFVTVKAVQFHLGHVYRKLDVARREDLRGALADGGNGAP